MLKASVATVDSLPGKAQPTGMLKPRFPALLSTDSIHHAVKSTQKVESHGLVMRSPCNCHARVRVVQGELLCCISGKRRASEKKAVDRPLRVFSDLQKCGQEKIEAAGLTTAAAAKNGGLSGDARRPVRG